MRKAPRATAAPAKGTAPPAKGGVKGGAAPPPAPPEPEPIDGKELWMATDALAKTKALRNQFQLERDKIAAFWEITKQEAENVKSELRNKEREKAEMVERHQVELKVYKQKIRHVLYEHKVHLSNMKLEAERALKAKQEEHREKEDELLRDRRDLAMLLREQDLQQRDIKAALKEQQDEEITTQLKDFERQMKELHLKYDRKIRSLRDEMDARRKDEIAVIERRKEEQIAELREMHEKAFREIRDYYTEITSSNLEAIKTLKEEVYSRKKQEAANEKAMFEIAQTNKRLTEPLTKAQKQKKILENQLADYERDRAALKATKQELRQLEQRHKTLSWEHEVLGQRFTKLQTDRDLIFEQYNSTLQEIQKKAVFKRVLLHHKLEVVQSQIERKDAQLAEVIKTTAGADAESVAAAQKRISDVVEDKNRTIESLQQLLAALTLQHERRVSAYDRHLVENGVFTLPSEPAPHP